MIGRDGIGEKRKRTGTRRVENEGGKMKTMKSGELSLALFYLLIQRGHMPRNVAISMITIYLLFLSLSVSLS